MFIQQQSLAGVALLEVLREVLHRVCLQTHYPFSGEVEKHRLPCDWVVLLAGPEKLADEFVLTSGDGPHAVELLDALHEELHALLVHLISCLRLRPRLH